MKYIELLGTELKSEFLCDLFETYDVEVIYSYDRIQENTLDEYHATISELGLQLIFDQNQFLKTLFIKPVSTNSFDPFDNDERIRRFESKSEAIAFATDNGQEIVVGAAEFLGELSDWVRFEGDSYSIHYEFVDSELRMITLQRV